MKLLAHVDRIFTDPYLVLYPQFSFYQIDITVRGCSCSDIANAEGEGRCNGIPASLEPRADRDKPFCYVQLPSSCPDLQHSDVDQIRNSSGVFAYHAPLKISNVACEQGKLVN